MRNTSHGCLEPEQGLPLHLGPMPLGALPGPSNAHNDFWARWLLGKAGFSPVLKFCSIAYSLPARKYQRTFLIIFLVILHLVTDQFQTRSQICDFTAAVSRVLYFFPVGKIPVLISSICFVLARRFPWSLSCPLDGAFSNTSEFVLISLFKLLMKM